MRTPWARSSLLAICLAFAAFPAALAGTATAPEISDPEGDHQPVPDQFRGGDLVAGWFSAETDTTITVNIQAAGDITGGNAGGVPTTYYYYTFGFKSGGTEYLATAEVHWEALLTPGGVASSGQLDGGLISLVIPRSAIGDPPRGADLSDPYVLADVRRPEHSQVLVSDRAPDEGFGSPYTFKAGKGASAASPTSAPPTPSGSGAPAAPQNGTGAPEAPEAPDAPATGPSTGNGTSSSPAPPATGGAGNGTANETAPALAAKASTPGPAMAVAGAGIAVAAWMRRRR